MPATISRRSLGTAIATRLVGVSNATGYYGQVGAKNGLPGVTDTPDDPPTKSGSDLRVRPYFVVAPGIGDPGTETDLGDCGVDLDWSFTVRAAAGDVDDLLALVDRIESRLYRWSPGPLGPPDAPVLTGRISHPVGSTTQLLTDRAVTPHRHFTVLQYALTAHT